MRDSAIGQLMRSRGKAPSPDHVLQQDGESQARRAQLVAQQLKLVADEVK